MFENPRIEESPQRRPGYCRGCRASSLAREWIMDTDCDDEDHPAYAIQFCNVCFDRLAKLAGYQKMQMIERLHDEYVHDLEREVNELRNVSRVLGILGIDPDRIIRLSVAGNEDSEQLPAGTDELDQPVLSGEDATDRTDESGENGTPKYSARRKVRTSKSSDDNELAGLRAGESDSAGVHIDLGTI